MAVAAQAFIFDGQISIDRALNGPTITVRYSDAHAAIVEMLVNGESIATRTVNASKANGETTFTLNLSGLAAGENRVEIRLYDKAGQLLASKTTLVTAEHDKGPVFISAPKQGATVQGTLDIKVGFEQQFKNSYVSFFIDNQFKSLSNVPPFEFNWDTSKDSNGWHEIEAWVVDESSTTWKTRKVKVFVQNAGGRTIRETTPPQPVAKPAPTPVPAAAAVKPAVKPAPSVTTPLAMKVPAAKLTIIPIESVANSLHLAVTGMATSKPATLRPSATAGLKEMLPTGTRLALQAKPALPGASALKAPAAAAGAAMVSIVRGQRIPNIGTFAIVYNAQVVSFDVQPRVENGVPLTPFRHLVERAGGQVEWAHAQKNVSARAAGQEITIHIGDLFALINHQRIGLDRASFIDRGRTIVPVSFMRDALKVDVDYDKTTGHVLITSAKK